MVTPHSVAVSAYAFLAIFFFFLVRVNIPRLLQKWIEAVKVAIKSTAQKSFGGNVRSSR